MNWGRLCISCRLYDFMKTKGNIKSDELVSFDCQDASNIAINKLGNHHITLPDIVQLIS